MVRRVLATESQVSRDIVSFIIYLGKAPHHTIVHVGRTKWERKAEVSDGL